MPQRNASGRRPRKSPYLFMALAVILLVAGIVIGSRTLNAWDAYRAYAAVTPAPTPSVRPISVTQAPGFTAVPQVTATPTPEPTQPPLGSGSSGDRVTEMQKRLQELGYYQGKLDGQFGSGTRAAVKAFQRQNGLDADGVAGPKTLTALYSEKAKAFVPTPTPKTYDTLVGDIPLLVNKWNKLADDFEPAGLVTVKEQAGDLLLYDDNKFQGVGEAVDALINMIRDAKKDGVTPWKLGGAYRTIQDQRRIFNNRVEKYLKDNPDATRSTAISHTRLTVADPGCSEHHTGLAFDLNVPGAYFVDTAQYVWLEEHCWDYGFIMRYTDEKEEKTGIIGEEWHIRYVGLEHARRIHEMNMCLEEYVEYLNQLTSSN